MQLTLIKMSPEYECELLDPKHRHISISGPLLEAWRNINSSNKLSFVEWLEQYENSLPQQTKIEINQPSNCVAYFTADEQALCEASFVQGKAIINGSILECEIGSNGAPTSVALVIQANNKLYAASMKTGESSVFEYRVQHSSLSGGSDLYFAAESFASDGYFTLITDKSGHYKPQLYNFVYGIYTIQKLGADLSRTRIEVNKWKSTFDHNRTFIGGDKFLDLYLNRGFEDKDNFAGSHANIYDAIIECVKALHYKNKPKINVFVENLNEIFEISVDKHGKVLTQSFYEKYKYEEVLSKSSMNVNNKRRFSI